MCLLYCIHIHLLHDTVYSIHYCTYKHSLRWWWMPTQGWHNFSAWPEKSPLKLLSSIPFPDFFLGNIKEYIYIHTHTHIHTSYIWNHIQGVRKNVWLRVSVLAKPRHLEAPDAPKVTLILQSHRLKASFKAVHLRPNRIHLGLVFPRSSNMKWSHVILMFQLPVSDRDGWRYQNSSKWPLTLPPPPSFWSKICNIFWIKNDPPGNFSENSSVLIASPLPNAQLMNHARRNI